MMEAMPSATVKKLLKVQKALNTLLKEASVIAIGHYVNTVADSIEYSGQPLQPEVTVEGLTPGRDYQVVCSDNVEIGQATAVIKGIGNYKGQITRNFTILPTKASLTRLSKGKKKLTSKKTYTVKVRACKTLDENTYYGEWSETRKVKVK